VTEKQSKGKVSRLPLLLLAAGALFVFLGIYRGETRVVLQKAIRICLECIGIG
jgi:hypothetical protein